MPLIGQLLAFIASKFALLLVAIRASEYAFRFAVLAALAGLYVASVTLFNTVVAGWWSAIVSTSYGQLLGLLFPPVAGTVLGGLATLWTSVITYRYLSTLTRASVK